MTRLIIITTFIITGYCDLSCDKPLDHPAYGIMANGERTHWGAIACPPEYPFGTEIWLGGKWFMCKDRGGAIEGNHIDIWFPSCEQTKDFGVKVVAGGVKR